VADRGRAVDHGARDRQAAVGLEQLDDPGLLRPVDVRRGGHLPEPARVSAIADRGDRVHVGVPVHPGHDARVGEQQVAELGGQHAPADAWRAPVVHQRLQRMVAEQQHRPCGARGELAREPAELRGVDRALPAPYGFTVSSMRHRTMPWSKP
jgi:hypothetical protein